MTDTGMKSGRVWGGVWKAIRTALETAPDGCPTCPGPDAGLTFPEAGTPYDLWSLPIGMPRYRR